MLSEKMQAAMNKQINAELHSAYIYLSMSAYFEDANLTGMAQWMRMQSSEEVAHATKFFDFINERGGRVLLAPLDGVPTTWDSPLDVFKAAYAHEQKVTGMIHNLVDLALEERDHASNSFLQWFVYEQVEEESPADDIVQKLTLAGNSAPALLFLDAELGRRQAEAAAGE